LGLVERALKARRHRPLFMVDLAVPRDIEPEVGELDDVFLYTVDDLAQMVAVGMESRQAAVVQAEAIIEAQVEQFTHWLAARDAVPLIRSLRDTFERARRHELERALKRLAAGESAEKALSQLSQRLMNKFLHAPTQALQQAGEKDRRTLQQAAERLLRIHEQEPGFGNPEPE
jgi:glutamyl-tRNA reductase